MMTEEWRPVVGFEGCYEVSNLGRVKSFPKQTVKGTRLLNPTPVYVKKTGRLRFLVVGLCKDGEVKNFGVHTLVLEAFVEKKPKGKMACHYDGNPANNKVENLRWGTHQDNHDDMNRHGTKRLGSKNNWAILREAQVIEIKKKIKDGIDNWSLSDEYNMSWSGIQHIRVGNSWRHL